MAKKKTAKRRQFKSNRAPKPAKTAVMEAAPVSAPASAPARATTPRPAAAPATLVTSDGRNFGYVARDLRQIALLGGGLIVLLIILWYLFAHTGLGSAVYGLAGGNS